MKCYECNEQMTIIKDMPYHYTDCGLDNIYIYGMPQYNCPKCGEIYVSIPKIKQLHQVIGMSLCCQEERFIGKEIRFLRKELRLKAIDFAKVLSIDPATLSRYENEHESPGEQTEKLIRSTYLHAVGTSLAEPVSFNYLELFKHMATRPANRTKHININPVEWLNKVVPASCNGLIGCAA